MKHKLTRILCLTIVTLTLSCKEHVKICGEKWPVDTKYLLCKIDRPVDLSPLKKLGELESLGIFGTGNFNQNIDVLSHLPKLTNITLSEVSIPDFSALQNASNLCWLDLMSVKLDRTLSLAKLTQLKSLSISYGGFRDLSFVSKMVKLERLFISHSQVADLSAVRGLNSLNMLTLIDTEVVSVEPLEELYNLTDLYIAEAKITDISPLGKLTNLESLTVGKTPIKNIHTLQSLVKLRKLHLPDNHRFSDLSAISNLPLLEELNLDRASGVDDLSPITKLTRLRKLGVLETNYKMEHIEQIKNNNPNVTICGTYPQLGAKECKRFWLDSTNTPK